jgi:hypothetical protein
MANVRIEPITSIDDIPACAQLCSDAVRSDPFHTFIERYSSQPFYQSTVTRLKDAINPENKTDVAFKAVLPVDDGHGGVRDEIVGVTHWYVGYVNVPKVDPFAKKVVDKGNEIGPEEVAVGDEKGGTIPAPAAETADRSKAVMDRLVREHGNVYVGKIRGKKHVCKWPVQGRSSC